jgi:Cellulase (glycosyl hydrolase family 5)
MPALRRSAAILLLVLAVAGIGTPGAVLTGWSTVLRPRVETPGAGAAGLPWLHVEHRGRAGPFIADPQGRLVILRGVVSAGLVDFWSGTNPADLRPAPLQPLDPAAYDGRCPPNSATVRQPPLCRDDLRQMAALGFDVLRLALSWSLLEPRPGRYDQRYLDRVAQVVGWARDEGIHVILDMHENAYSRYLDRPAPPPLPGGSPTSLNQLTGAPSWAVLTDLWPSEVFGGQRELNPAVFAAFTNFWVNRHVDAPRGEAPGSGLQDHYIGALAALARRFRDDSTVAGYDLFNEPWPGFVPPPAFETLFLFPFYRRVIDALSGAGDGLPCPASVPAVPACGYPDLGIHDRSHLFFVEPDHLREQTDLPTSPPAPFSSSGNLVYAIHAYTHVFTLDALAGQDPRRASYPPGGLELSDASGELEASALGAALFVDEYGDDPGEDSPLLAAQLREQERHLVGSTFWTWKENCALTTTWGVYDGVYGGQPDQRCAYDRAPTAQDTAPKNLSGCLRADRARLLARPWPLALAAASTNVSYEYDPGTGGLRMSAAAPAGATETLLAVPAQVRGAVTVDGRAAITATDQAANGGRLVHVRPAGGAYAVTVQPAPLALAAC